MIQCKTCEGFVPAQSNNCPNCLVSITPESIAYRKIKIAATALGAGIVSMTLMACYGAPPDDMHLYRDKNKSEPCSEEDKNNTAKPDDSTKNNQ